MLGTSGQLLQESLIPQDRAGLLPADREIDARYQDARVAEHIFDHAASTCRCVYVLFLGVGFPHANLLLQKFQTSNV